MLRVEDLEQQIAAFLRTLRIPERVLAVVQAALEEDAAGAEARVAAERTKTRIEEDTLEREATNLRRLRLRDRLTDAEFDKEQERITNERTALSERRRQLKEGVAIEPLMRALSLRNEAASAFLDGDTDRKRAIFNLACMNPTLTERELRFEARFPFSPLTKNDANCNWYGLINAMRTLCRDRQRYSELVSRVKAVA